MSNYVIIKKIGSGSYGEVFLCQDSNGQYFAIKKLSKEKIQGPKLERETKSLHKVRGVPGAVFLQDQFEDAENHYLVFEYLKGQDLLKMITERKSPFSENDARLILKQMLRTLKEVHTKGVIHHDLKLENVVVDCTLSQWKTTLIDFGLAEICDRNNDSTNKDRGSYEYIAPEKIYPNSMYNGKEGYFSGYKADVWGAGTILYALLFNQFPWSKAERKKAVEEKRPHPPLLFPSTVKVSEDAKALLKRMLCVEFEERATVDETLKHPWFQPRSLTQRILGVSFS